MKIKQYIALGAVLCLSLSSCKKDFLETEPTNLLSDSKLAKMPKNIGDDIRQGLFNGMYALLYAEYPGGSTSHIDFGQKATDIYLDLLSGDHIKATNNRGIFSALQRYQATTDYTSVENSILWRFYYSLIYSANELLGSLGDDVSTLSSTGKAQRGQALAMRGYAYYYLTQLFAPEYKPEALICPLYTNAEQENLPLSKQSDIYAQIIADLTEAKTLLKDFDRTNKTQFNEDIASMFLALTYATMGNYTPVETLTQEIIDSKRYTPFGPTDIVYDPVTNTGGGFNNANLSGVMWGTDITEEMGLDLVSWWGVSDVFIYGYAWGGDPRCINDALYNSIHSDDIRKKQFDDWSTKPETYKEGTTEKVNKVFGNKSYVNIASNKFFNSRRIWGGGRVVTDDYIYMRVDEVYFLNAEAKAFLGKDAEARAVLKSYLADRITDLSYLDTLSGQNLKDELYLQYRIEFLGEGKSFLAMKRFKATNNTGTNRFDTSNRNIDIAYNDNRLYFKIPEQERLHNPNLNLPAGY